MNPVNCGSEPCTRPVVYYGRILLGEITPLLSALRKTTRWAAHYEEKESDPLIQQLKELQTKVLQLEPNDRLEPSIFLDPFLALIRSENTTGPITKSALAAVNRMLCYGLLSTDDKNVVAAVESIAAAVTHARFVGSDPGADEVVLWEILTVLRTLILGPVGCLLSNESVCEILNSSFRICFETRLSELLRTCTEDTLRHMIQLLFSRLPQFQDDPLNSSQSQRLKMHAGGTGDTNEPKKSKNIPSKETPSNDTPSPDTTDEGAPESSAPESVEEVQLSSIQEITEVPTAEISDVASIDSGLSETPIVLDISHTHLAPEKDSIEKVDETPAKEEGNSSDVKQNEEKEIVSSLEANEDFTNLQGVKFVQDECNSEGHSLSPYGLPCVREVFRFLISLTSSKNDQSSMTIVHTALNLITVALEIGAEHMNYRHSLLVLIKDQLCRNLFRLLKVDVKPATFVASLRVCTLLFESLRHHLKFQLEMFINHLIGIISSESSNVLYMHKELALESIVILWRMPGLTTELFMNYDCNLYSSNAFEDLSKILSKNAYPVQGLYSTNLLSLDAFLTLTDMINSHYKHIPVKPSSRQKELPNKNTMDETNAIVTPFYSGYLLGVGLLGGYSPVTPILKARVVLSGSSEVSRENLLMLKEKKRMLTSGTEQFNAKPDKGIQFLQTNKVLGTTTSDIAFFLKENPHLDKKVLGDYISKKKNVEILSAFVKSFDFHDLRIDQCLRTFLESFRLPGEAPVISIIIEHFSSHWHSSNGSPFGKDDAAFTLAYAVIMLNVDQHNQNAKKQNIPMTLDQFRNNLRGVNNGGDFDVKMLEEIYQAIRSEEIVMPSEHTGLVRDNYLWKMLLKRGRTKEGEYILDTKDYSLDQDLFSLSGRPTIASLSYLFDKAVEESLICKSINGFEKCASVAARFGMSDIFDILVVSLCKFTTVSNSNEPYMHIAANFGGNKKSQLAMRTLFHLVIKHGDILCEGWKNIIELFLSLFKCQLLPNSLVESEDFVEASGKVCLVKEESPNVPKVESGLFSSLYSYISLGDGTSPRGSGADDAELIEAAKTCIIACHPERLISESAFLRYDSLNELIQAVMGAGNVGNLTELHNCSTGSTENLSTTLDEYSQAFLLEILVSVLIANKDRAGGIWPAIRDHIYSILMGAAAAEKNFLLERCVVAILKVAKLLLRRRELANLILQSLRMLLLLRSNVLSRVALQIVAGIYEILGLNADHIHHHDDWAILYTLLECAGAGAKPPPIINPLSHDDDEAGKEVSPEPPEAPNQNIEVTVCGSAESIPSKTDNTDNAEVKSSTTEATQNTGGWILVGREGEIEPVPVKTVSVNEWDIVHQRSLGEHKPEALMKAIDTLSFLVRDGHITAVSLSSVVQACRTFVEATLNGGKIEPKETAKSPAKSRHKTWKKDDRIKRPNSPSEASQQSAEEQNLETIALSYQQASEKLLDLMDTLHISSSRILEAETKKEAAHWPFSASLWHMALCPLLQGIARYCCDSRATIRSLAMTYLQRALLNHDLQTLSAMEWESCFNKVLFPLLAKLLKPPEHMNNNALEETRLRAATLVQKVYLRHLTPLLTLPTFTALWLTILDFMDKYLNTHRSDHLSDAVPEILKNMLLVMETTQVFHTMDGFTHLWTITWDRIDAFLPDLRLELFKSHPPSEIHKVDRPISPSSEEAAVEGTNELPFKPPTSDESTVIEVGDDDEDLIKDNMEDITLKEQEVVRLSLSQECLPALDNVVILQPPLPHIYPISSIPPSSPTKETKELREGQVSPVVPISQNTNVPYFYIGTPAATDSYQQFNLPLNSSPKCETVDNGALP